MAQGKKRLGEILQELGLIKEEQLKEALEEQKVTGERLGEILVKLGYIESDRLYDALGIQFGIVPVKLSQQRIESKVIEKVPASIARRQKIIPIKVDDNKLTVAMADPLNLLALDNLRMMLGCEVEGALASEEEIVEALEKYYGREEDTAASMIQELSEQDITFEETGEETTGEEDTDETPVIKLVSLLILEAFRTRASDIHIEPLENRFRIRYRVDGVLHEVPGPPKRLQGSVISRVKIMSGMQIEEKRLPQDGRIKLNLLGKEVDLRVSTLPGLYGESTVLRILDKSSLRLGMEELGFQPKDQELWESLLNLPNGIILVTGPTGSGKTTTLYASLHKLNQPDRKLITVEDPVEYQLSGINQIQVKPKIGLTFASTLRSMLRQAPDIIMVGEIRDSETAEIAIRSALTGHLVFSTLHTNDAPTAVTRLMDMGAKPFLVASSIQAILAQRLVRTICQNCKEPYEPRPHELTEMRSILGDIGDIQLYHGKGCEECNNTGYKERKGIFELLVMSGPIRQLVMEGVPSSKIREKARQLGMRTLREDGWQKVAQGLTTPMEVSRVTQKDID